jgi:hypothetical protein
MPDPSAQVIGSHRPGPANEITHVVNSAADSGRTVSTLIRSVSGGAEHTGEGPGQVRRQAERLGRSSAELTRRVSVFHLDA